MGVISNCFLSVRDGETLHFDQDNKSRLTFVDLDGYAIVPIENYEDLVESVKQMKSLKDAESETKKIIQSITKET